MSEEKVVDIRSKQPHLCGAAKCLHCGHEWVAIAEIGTLELECPDCHLFKGVYNSVTAPDKVWQCNCGCFHFFVSTEAAICCHCGLAQVFG